MNKGIQKAVDTFKRESVRFEAMSSSEIATYRKLEKLQNKLTKKGGK